MYYKHIIVASVLLGVVLIAIMLITARFLWSHKETKYNNDSNGAYSVDPHEQRFELFATDRSWVRMFMPKRDRGDWVPSLSGIIKAGDEGVYSSALFSDLNGVSGEIPLNVLYDAFAQELRSRPLAERSAYPPAISKLLSSTRSRVRRTQSVHVSRDARPLAPRRARTSVDVAERGLLRSRSTRTTPVLVSTFNSIPFSESSATRAATPSVWTQDLQHAQYFDDKRGVAVSSGELAALSVVLGSPLSLARAVNGQEEAGLTSDRKNSAFGISISESATENGKSRIVLQQHGQSVSQLPAKGSGYSTLLAKHLATGSIPFSAGKSTVSAILITNDTYEAIKTGSCLHIQSSSPETKASKFFTSLPSSRQPHFHTLVESATSTSTPLLLHSIADLVFTGGFVPMASIPVISTVRFVASAGLPPARLLQRLEALVDKVHRKSPHLQLFGPLFDTANAGLLFRERERLGKLATGSLVEDSLADKKARMHRYITLLERLMALVPDMKPHDVLAAVREATKNEIQRSYEEAVTATRNPAAALDRISGIDFQAQTQSAYPFVSSKRRISGMSRKSKRSSSGSGGGTPQRGSGSAAMSPRASSMFPPDNLGTQVEGILKSELPFDVPTIATVVRLVLVAWTLSVQAVAWEDGENGVRLDSLEGLPEKMVLY